MSLSERLEEWVEARKGALIVGLMGLILLGTGIIVWRFTGQAQVEGIKVLSASSVASGSGSLVVDVGGAVARPGVYTLAGGSRIVEALEKAGGITGEADGEWIDKYLNRSERVKDGQKVYIPKKSEITQTSGSGSAVNETGSLDGKININVASQTELETLSGVGPVTAQKIVEGRPYGRIEELTEKKIVGQSVYSKISGQIVVW